MPDSTFNNADTDDASLENFFCRPIKVKSIVWTPGSDIFNTFNPWTDFFENPRVLNRITNYNLLRCKLKCKIILNGNSFYFGKAIASYQPIHFRDDMTKVRQLFPTDIIGASQRPHVYLDPTNSQGGTLTLPFFWYENALRIPDMEWRSMGRVNIRSINDLKHANGSTDSITLSVFVWAEEVNLSIPTANEPGALVAQMGEYTGDEYGKGIVSRPAGFIAKVAGALSNIAPIAPYAKATQMAASTVSAVASMFGFSRPAILEDIVPYRPTYVGNMANTNVPDTVTKLTLDGKQELSIDPRTMGLGTADEMTIKSIACRESYLTSFDWNQVSTAETLLWNSEVSPVLWAENANELHFPATAFAALPFTHWRGTMKFRFQVVASAFHKGRIKITYDPSYPLTNEYNTNYTHIVDLAKEKDFTIDIGWGQERSMIEHRDPTVDDIPYKATALGADPGLKANGIISVYVVNELTTPNVTPDNDVEVNVFVSMGEDFEVFNPSSEIIENLVLFAPQMGESSAPRSARASILPGGRSKQVKLRALELFREKRLSHEPFHLNKVPRYAVQSKETQTSLAPLSQMVIALSGLLMSCTYALYMYTKHKFKKDSGHPVVQMTAQMAEKESHPDADLTTAENEPMKLVASDQKAATMSDSDNTVSVFYGDPIVSFRQCLKRYNYHQSYHLDDTGDLFYKINANNFPVYRGYALSGALHNASLPLNPTPYNYVNTTLLNWVTTAYVARRGALRWKYLRTGGSTDDMMYCNRLVPTGGTTGVTTTARGTTTSSSDSRARQTLMEISHMWAGAHATHVANNPALEVELPYYSNLRFSPAKDSSPNDGLEAQQHMHQVGGTWSLTTADVGAIHAFVSIGEDFTLNFFTGAPTYYAVDKSTEVTAA